MKTGPVPFSNFLLRIFLGVFFCLGLRDLLEVSLHEVGNIVIVIILRYGGHGGGGTGPRRCLRGHALKLGQIIHAELRNDRGEQLLQRLGLGLAGDDVRVGRDRGLNCGTQNATSVRKHPAMSTAKIWLLTLRVAEVDNAAIVLSTV